MIRALWTVAAVAALSTVAHAGPLVERGGLLVGGSAGYGSIRCSDCTAVNGPALHVRVGATLPGREDLAFMIDSSLITGKQGADRLWSGAYVVAGQYWVRPEVWVKAGAGVGRLSGSGDIETSTALALLGAAGYEVGRSERVAWSLEARFSSAGYAYEVTPTSTGRSQRVNNISLLLGATWY